MILPMQSWSESFWGTDDVGDSNHSDSLFCNCVSDVRVWRFPHAGRRQDWTVFGILFSCHRDSSHMADMGNHVGIVFLLCCRALHWIRFRADRTQTAQNGDADADYAQ